MLQKSLATVASDAQRPLRPFVLPPLELLNESPPTPVYHESAAREKQAVLMQTLNDFKIGANVSQVAMGPTVTRYEVQLEPGILVKKIVALADNLAMSLAAIDVRVEAPIPGKAAIGIEVPNDVCQMVSLRECLATNEFMSAPSKLTFALGKDVAGVYKYADLTRMPHLLVGGSTNSGKSVCLNTIISSILYRATPREVKFVMIDPKRVELSLYDGIPHLLAPVIKDVKQAAGIFRSVLKEMEERYDRFARLGTRNIDGFNSRVPPEERLPFIVVVVDELADLMMQQGPEVETSICRLAQLARPTGIHLVVSTSRPSVDVITGTIKANISSRIAFAVATQVDSRTIIDMPGADRLIGRGDMLFMPIDAAKPVRVQGCYVGERETEDLVRYLRDQEEASYTMIPSETSASGAGDDDSDDGSSDELFEPCVRWLIVQGQCSTSSLQRKFKIGYTRAARLVEIMEARGIVGAQDGVKPREILLHKEALDIFFAGPDEDARTAQTFREEAPPSRIINPQKERQQPPLLQKVPEKATSSNISVLLNELNGLTGLEGVKADVSQLVNFLRIQQLRKAKGLSAPDQSLHMVFTGNPGTGKTTIARLIAQIYKSMGILSKGQFIETDRVGLIGGYLGQTAIKTQEIVESAFGGVLFIDEAYSLTEDTYGRDMYGQEAVATLLKLMEDHRDDLIVIVAGYTEPMQKFIRSNPGLQSRFNKFLHFDDYAPAELTEIFRHFAAQGDYRLHPATELKLTDVFSALYAQRDETFGNARLARNLFEKAINAHAGRMVSAGATDEESLVTLYPEDVPQG